MARTLVGMAAMLALALGAAARAEPAPGAALEGAWRADISESHALVLVLGTASVEMRLDGGGAVTTLWSGRMTFPEGEAGRHFDWVGLKAGGAPMPDNKCLYRLSGDTLLLIGGGPDARPTRLLSGPGARTLVFTRVAR